MEPKLSLAFNWVIYMTGSANSPDEWLMTVEHSTKRMLELFDAMPTVKGPDGAEYSLATREHLKAVKNGWLDRVWGDAGLWPAQGNPRDVMQRDFDRRFRENYRAISRMRESREAVATAPAMK